MSALINRRIPDKDTSLRAWLGSYQRQADYARADCHLAAACIRIQMSQFCIAVSLGTHTHMSRHDHRHGRLSGCVGRVCVIDPFALARCTTIPEAADAIGFDVRRKMPSRGR